MDHPDTHQRGSDFEGQGEGKSTMHPSVAPPGF